MRRTLHHGRSYDSPNDPVLANCTENILVEDVRVTNGVGMSIGSVPPHSDVNCVRNVTFRRINFTRPFKAIYVKTETWNPDDSPDASGIIDNVTYEHIRIVVGLGFQLGSRESMEQLQLEASYSKHQPSRLYS